MITTKCQLPSRRANEQSNFLSLKWETVLKADEPQVGQWHEDVEKTCEYYHIITFPEWNNSPTIRFTGEDCLEKNHQQHWDEQMKRYWELKEEVRV
jgi:hypothetical protein